MKKEKITITGKRIKVKDLEKLGKVLEKEEEKEKKGYPQGWEKELRSYLRAKFIGILAREKWNKNDIEDVLDGMKELLKSEREKWEKEQIYVKKNL